VDASFPLDRNKMDIGMCICYDQGSYVLAQTRWLSLLLDVMKANPCDLFALRWVKELQPNNVSFKFDSKRVVDNFNSDKNDESDFGAIIRNCYFLFFFFINLHVEFIYRQANRVAHSIFRVTIFLTSIQLHIDILTCIRYIIIKEMR